MCMRDIVSSVSTKETFAPEFDAMTGLDLNRAGSALLMLRRVGGRRGHGEEREQHMNINAMLISLLPD